VKRHAALVQHEADAELMRDLAGLLEAHVRLEERRLFPLIEQTFTQP
jgi:hypothetical protein